MDYNIREAAHILRLDERTVRHHIESGKLSARRERSQWIISSENLNAFIQSQKPRSEEAGSSKLAEGPAGIPGEEKLLRALWERLDNLEKRLEEKEELLEENRRLLQELRNKEEELARKDSEIDRLQRDLLYQKHVLDKEREDQQKILDEKWEVLQKETAERLEAEREHLAEKLAIEQKHWAERFAVEHERYGEKLAEAKYRESLWSRLVKMMTWS